MLADAIRAEGFRLSKNRTALLWSTLFVPVAGIAISVISNTVVKATADKMTADPNAPAELRAMVAGGPLNLGDTLLSAAGQLANPFLLLFVLIGAAAIYAGDYRWETWRLISARNSRSNLLLGKLAVTSLLGLLALVLMLVSSLGDGLIRALVFDRPLTFSMDAADAGKATLLAGLSWLRVIQFTMLGMLAATVTRSLLAALFVPLVLGVVQFFVPNGLAQMGIMPDSWLSVLLNPGGAIEAIQMMVAPPPNSGAAPDGLLLKAWSSAALWTLVPLAAALAWFGRQDLSKE